MLCSSSLVMASLLYEKPSRRNGGGVSQPKEGLSKGEQSVCPLPWAPSRSRQPGKEAAIHHPSGWKAGASGLKDT